MHASRLVLAWLLLAALPRAGSGASVWLAHGLTKILPDSLPATPPQELELCRGEVGSLQLAVRSDEPLPTAWLRPFTLSLGGQRIVVPEAAIYRQLTVPVTVPSGNAERRPMAWPDPLVPQEHLRDSSIAAGRTAAWWIDVAVPLEAAPGHYRGALELVLDGQVIRVPVGLNVLDVVLPVERHVRANVAVYYDDILLAYANQQWRVGLPPWTKDSPEYVAIKERIYELLLQHRFCAYDLPVPLTSPAADRWYRDPRVHSIRLPWLDDHGSRLTVDGAARATERGAAGKLYYYAADEPPAAAYPSVKAVAAELDRLLPQVPFVATVAPVPELLGAVDIWCPNFSNYLGLGYLDMDLLAERRARGEETWWYTCVVPLHPYPTWLVDDDAVAPRASIWAMARYGLTGFVYSMAHGWSPDPYASVTSFNNTNGDGLLIYPGQPYGTSEPLPSLRLKLLRDGLQDYELLRLLALEMTTAARRRQVAGFDGAGLLHWLTEPVVQTPYAIERDPEVLLAVRRTVLDLLRLARREDFSIERRAGPAGYELRGTIRAGQPLRADGLHLETGSGRWRVDLPLEQEHVSLAVGPAGVPVTLPLARPRLPARLPAWAGVTRTVTEPVVDGQATEAVWQNAEPLRLGTAEVRLAWTDQALYVCAHEARQVTLLLSPDRSPETVYAFAFAGEPLRAFRRTAQGRDPAFQPLWSAAAKEVSEACLPFSLFGGPPDVGDSWRATLIATTESQRHFWHDHHGDLRQLPRLVFRGGSAPR